MNEEQYSSDELYHWGRLGMKWYKHIFSDIKKVALEYHKRKTKEKNIKENTKLQIKKLKKIAKEEARKRKLQKQQDEKIKKAKRYILEKYNVDYGKDNIPNKEKTKSKSKSDPLTKNEIKKLSDSDLKDRINRLDSEKKLIELQNHHATNGQKFVSAVAKNVLIPAATTASKDLVTNFIKKYGEMGMDSFDKGLKKKRNS